MPPKTRRSPTDSPDHSTSQRDDPNKTVPEDCEEPARGSEENETTQDQTTNLSPIPNLQDRTPTKQEEATDQTNASQQQPPNPPPPIPNIRNLIILHFLTGRLDRLLARLQHLLYNDPELLQTFPDNPHARPSDRAPQRQQQRARAQSSDRQARPHAPIATARRRRRRSSDGSGPDDGGSSEGSGTTTGRGDENGGGGGAVGETRAAVRFPEEEEEWEPPALLPLTAQQQFEEDVETVACCWLYMVVMVVWFISVCLLWERTLIRYFL